MSLIDLAEKFSKLQKDLQESENNRLELISQNNKETFSLNSKFTTCRKELEKSEALRHSLEYELSVAKSQLNKAHSEKDKCLHDVIKRSDGKD